MKSLILLLLVVSATSYAQTCDDELDRFPGELKTLLENNSDKITRLTDALEQQGKTKSSKKLVYELQFNDPDVSPLTSAYFEEAMAFFNAFAAKECQALLTAHRRLTDIENERTALIIEKLNAM